MTIWIPCFRCAWNAARKHEFQAWLSRMWNRQEEAGLAAAYNATFTSTQGQQVLQHLLDEVYCKVYEGTDPSAALVMNAKRAIVDEILYNIDLGRNPMKYTPTQSSMEEVSGA